MGKNIFTILFIGLLAVRAYAQSDGVVTAEAGKVLVMSAAFKDGEMMAAAYTCDGENISPPVSWLGIPGGAKSVALICDDPDASPNTWVHWVVFNIPPEVRELPENILNTDILPNGAIQGMNDFRKVGYNGPCPPSGVHRYFFKVYALDVMLSLKPGATKKDIEWAMRGHVLARGELVGKYKR